MKHQKVLTYCPSLNAITGSITASLLMCQLEYWFDKTKGDVFYKFLEPCVHSGYKKGDSWTEEMGFSKAEFRHAFSRIGKVYKSKQAFLNSKDPFEGKLYLSYYDRYTKLTYYKRNTTAVTLVLRSQHCKLPYTKDYNTSISHSSEDNQIETARMVELFTQCCPSLKAYATLSLKCKNGLKDLLNKLREKGLEVWSTLQRVFKLVEASDFLCGRLPHSRWRAALSWILRPDKFFAILEGKYAPFAPTIPTHKSLPTSVSASVSVPTYSASSSFGRFIRPFNRVESHNFDLAELEAKERAHQMERYLKTIQKAHSSFS